LLISYIVLLQKSSFSIVAFKTLDISQGSVATHVRCGGIFSNSITIIFSWFWWWNNCENRLIFGKVKAYKNMVPVLGHPVEMHKILIVSHGHHHRHHRRHHHRRHWLPVAHNVSDAGAKCVIPRQLTGRVSDHVLNTATTVCLITAQHRRLLCRSPCYEWELPGAAIAPYENARYEITGPENEDINMPDL